MPNAGTNGQETVGFKSSAAAGSSSGTVSVFSMKRGLVVLAIVVALAAFAWFASSSSSSTPTARATPSKSRGPVLVYGDSLIEQATPYLQSTDQVRAFGGTALCDWVDKMARAANVEQPSMMVVEFVGNDLTPCMQGYQTPDQVRAKYEADMARLKQLVDAPILWVGPTKDFLVDQFEPRLLGLLEEAPRLAAKLQRGKRMKKTRKIVAGVPVRLAHAGSSSALKSDPAALASSSSRANGFSLLWP